MKHLKCLRAYFMKKYRKNVTINIVFMYSYHLGFEFVGRLWSGYICIFLPSVSNSNEILIIANQLVSYVQLSSCQKLTIVKKRKRNFNTPYEDTIILQSRKQF